MMTNRLNFKAALEREFGGEFTYVTHNDNVCVYQKNNDVKYAVSRKIGQHNVAMQYGLKDWIKLGQLQV